jgi:NAD(P)-dependent dehydrogenase (short-subunit alcohol dehydrogenase family)
MYEELAQGVPLVDKQQQLFRRLANPSEIAALVAFLLGAESKFVTKAAYGIDGGFMG